MSRNRSPRIFIFIIIGILTILVGSIIVIKVNAQDQNANDIFERLDQKGVPVIKIMTINRFPYEIEINLQSKSENNHLALDDNWFMLLAHREATRAHRIGLQLTRYQLNVYNIKGELISSTDTYLHPEDMSHKSQPGMSVVDIQTTRKIVKDNLQLADLSLDELEVTPEDTLGSNGQVVFIQVSGKDLEGVNRSLPRFLDSLFQLLDTVNSQKGTNIVLCHLRITDTAGNVLLDYVQDLEGGSTQWTSAEGLYSDWFPNPSLAPTSTPPSTSVESGYPVLPTTTTHPYP